MFLARIALRGKRTRRVSDRAGRPASELGTLGANLAVCR